MKNKFLCFLVFMVLLAAVSPVLAYEKSSQNPMPYLVDGFIGYEFDGIVDTVANARVYVQNERTGYEITIKTNDKGYFLEDLRSMLVENSWEFPYQFGDIIKIKICSDENNVNCVQRVQIGARELCTKVNGENCGDLAGAVGGVVVNFNLGPDDLVYDEDYKEEVTVKEWYDRHRGAVNITTAIILILAAAMVGLYKYDKLKYRWMPGMAGIIKWRLRNWVKAFNDPTKSDEEVEKLRKTLYKTANTITRKYVRSVEDGDIEPQV